MSELARGDMGLIRRPAPAVSPGGEVTAGVLGEAAVELADRRVHRSRIPAVLALIGFVVGTAVAEVVILSLLGGSPVAAPRSSGSLADPASWWWALAALRDPSLALASAALGGLPGAIAGHMAAVRRLRRDRLDGLWDRSISG